MGAASAGEGMEKAADGRVTAIVLDVSLPDMDGFEVCRELRRRERWTPVLMLTARDAVDDRVKGLDAGADDYLTKPFAFAELFARVRSITRREPAARPTTLNVDGASSGFGFSTIADIRDIRSPCFLLIGLEATIPYDDTSLRGTGTQPKTDAACS